MAEITERDAKKEILKYRIHGLASKNREVKNLQDKHNIQKAMKRLAKDDPKLFVEAFVDLVGETTNRLAEQYQRTGREDKIPALIESVRNTFKSKK